MFDSDIFLGMKICQVFFGWLDLSIGTFWGIQNNMKISGSARVFKPHISSHKVQPNLSCGCFNIY